MFFRRPKKEIIEKPVEKCHFCQKRDSIGKVEGINYCHNSICANKFHQAVAQKKQSKERLKNKKKK